MLKGKRIFLSALKNEDIKILFKWVNDPELIRFSTWYKPIHWKNHKEWFDKVRKDNIKMILGIRLIKSKKLIGFCKLINIHPIYRSAEMQIKIGEKQFLSKGYGTEALKLLLKFAWTDLNLHRVYCLVFKDNEKAIKTYEKVGFLKEGMMKDAVFIDGQYKDIGIMGTVLDQR